LYTQRTRGKEPSLTADHTLDVVRAYQAAWTRKDFDRAAALLSPSLRVEVSINDYPSKESFAQALATFGSLVTHVELLSEMSSGSEAMQLYDMEVEGLGTMRIVEHFTVAEGRITQLRQIHDTAALRAGATG
jgi:ketosteroid isomerase-like protein